MRIEMMNGIFRLLSVAGLLLIFLAAGAVAQETAVVPVVDGHLGSCSADFTVVDMKGSPIYNAKIDVSLRYGFMGLRRMSLEVGTNSDGKARVAGLPDKSKNPFRFEITSGSLFESVLLNIQDRCNDTFHVILGRE
jgi:hypothetical protein